MWRISSDESIAIEVQESRNEFESIAESCKSDKVDDLQQTIYGSANR